MASDNSGNFATNTTASLTIRGPRGGAAFNTLVADGTWDSGTLAVQIENATEDDWLTVGSLTSDDFINFQVRAAKYRLQFSGGGGSQNVNWKVF